MEPWKRIVDDTFLKIAENLFEYFTSKEFDKEWSKWRFSDGTPLAATKIRDCIYFAFTVRSETTALTEIIIENSVMSQLSLVKQLDVCKFVPIQEIIKISLGRVADEEQDIYQELLCEYKRLSSSRVSKDSSD